MTQEETAMPEPSWSELLGLTPPTCPRCGLESILGLKMLLGERMCPGCARAAVEHRGNTIFVTGHRPAGRHRESGTSEVGPAPFVEVERPEPDEPELDQLDLDEPEPVMIIHPSPAVAEFNPTPIPVPSPDYGLGRPGLLDLSRWMRKEWA
jgi:hypothetical protein